MPRNQTDRTREKRLRRAAARQHLVLKKSRLRDPRALGYGGYMLVDRDNRCLLGAHPYAYSATIDEIEKYLMGEQEGCS
jgi:hypothetical protein